MVEGRWSVGGKQGQLCSVPEMVLQRATRAVWDFTGPSQAKAGPSFRSGFWVLTLEPCLKPQTWDKATWGINAKLHGDRALGLPSDPKGPNRWSPTGLPVCLRCKSDPWPSFVPDLGRNCGKPLPVWIKMQPRRAWLKVTDRPVLSPDSFPLVRSYLP